MRIVEPVARLSASEHARFREFELRNEPVVLAGAVASWKAVTSWTPQSLAARLGHAPAGFKVSTSNAHPDFRSPSLAVSFARGSAPFGEFLARITEGPPEERTRWLFTGDEQFLLRRREGRTFIDEHYRPLLDDVHIPDLFPEDRLYTVWAWFSAKGVRTWLHYDNNRCHNLNAQITGSKECVLFPPEELKRLFPFPLGGKNPAYNCSQIDIDAPDLERFADFADVPCRHATIEAGDLLFIPVFWFHAFLHTGDFNSNVNFWWRPEHVPDSPVARRQTLLDLVAASDLDPRSAAAAPILAELDRAALG